MPIITPDTYQNIAIAASVYFNEYTKDTRSLMDTGIVTRNPPNINTDGESFIGQLRFYRDEDLYINTPSYSDSTEGTTSTITTGLMTYIKVARSWGFSTNELNAIISEEGSLKNVAQRVAERSRRGYRRLLDQELFSVLRGYAEAMAATQGITDFGQYDDPARSFMIDLNAAGHFGPQPTTQAEARTLIDTTVGSADGAKRLFEAVSMAWGEKEDSYYYLVVDNKTLTAIRSLNMTDQTRVVDGEVEFETILSGKFRLIARNEPPAVVPGAHLATPTNAVTEFSTRASYVIEPGAFAFRRIPIEVPIEAHTNPAAYRGAGEKSIWTRVSHVIHPYGMSWAGATNAFPSQSDLATGTNWSVEYSGTNLAILPIFHA